MRLIRFMVPLVVAHCSLANGDIEISSIRHAPRDPRAFEKVEVTFDLNETFSNPYDPDEADIWLDFRDPKGLQKSIPAFWFEGYSWSDGRLQPDGRRTWMARMVGEMPGRHQYRVRVNGTRGPITSDWQSITCTSGTRPGFVRVDRRNPRYLAFSDGTPYRPLGHNLCWASSGRTEQTLAWQSRLAAQGGNWTRYWMSMHALEWILRGEGAGLGRYSQQSCSRYDELLADAEKRGVYVQMCMDSFNAWSHVIFSSWNDNPYNVANGGMLNTPVEYLTNEEAKEHARKRFRYTVARWAYSTAVLCWEFWNEVDIMGTGGASYWNHRSQGAAWHGEMGRYVRSMDCYEHLRTTSFSNDRDPLRFPEIWSLPEMDIIQGHRYSWDLPNGHVALINQMRTYNKPCFLAEFGIQDATAPEPSPWWEEAGLGPEWRERVSPHRTLGPDEFDDPAGQTLHDMIWAAALLETMAGSWWWENWIEPANLYPVYRPLAAFLEEEDWAPLQLGDLDCGVLSNHAGLQIYGVQGPENAYLWVRHLNGGAVTGLRLELRGMADGALKVRFWNTYTGIAVLEQEVTIKGGNLNIDFPAFRKDMAVKVMPAPVSRK